LAEMCELKTSVTSGANFCQLCATATPQSSRTDASTTPEKSTLDTDCHTSAEVAPSTVAAAVAAAATTIRTVEQRHVGLQCDTLEKDGGTDEVTLQLQQQRQQQQQQQQRQ